MFGMAITTATRNSQPKTPDHQTELIMDFGTLTAAFTVSSEVWAEAS